MSDALSIGQIIDGILAHEGGWQDDDEDQPTNFGITLPSLEEYLKENGNVQFDGCTLLNTLRNISREFAKEIYLNSYYMKTGINRLPHQLQAMVLDAAVLQGRKNAVKMAQRCVKTADDGIIGPNTIGAMDQLQGVFAVGFVKQRVLHFSGVVKSNNAKLKYLSGWVERAFSYV